MFVRSPSGGFPGNRNDLFRDRQAFAGQGGFRHRQGCGLDHSSVRGDGIALFDDDDVAGNDIRSGDRDRGAITNDARVGRSHLAERSERGFSPLFLQVPHQRIQEDDCADRDRFVGQGGIALVQPERRRDRGRDEKQNHQDVAELPGKSLPRRLRRLGLEFVRAGLRQPSTGLVPHQTEGRIGPERGQHLLNGTLIFVGHNAASLYESCRSSDRTTCDWQPQSKNASRGAGFSAARAPFGAKAACGSTLVAGGQEGSKRSSET